MRRITLRAASLLIALTAIAGAGASLKAQPAEPICPVCIQDYKCCIKGNKALCIPSSQAC